jgi:spore maturation protein CgeB
MYRLFSKSKLVINSAIDAAGGDRGNIRCFETMGCGALLVSDEGNYPPGMENGQTLLAYDSLDEMEHVVERALSMPAQTSKIAKKGLDMVRQRYSKSAMWALFCKIVEDCN